MVHDSFLKSAYQRSRYWARSMIGGSLCGCVLRAGGGSIVAPRFGGAQRGGGIHAHATHISPPPCYGQTRNPLLRRLQPNPPQGTSASPKRRPTTGTWRSREWKGSWGWCTSQSHRMWMGASFRFRASKSIVNIDRSPFYSPHHPTLVLFINPGCTSARAARR